MREGKDSVKSEPQKLTVKRTRVKLGREPRARADRNLGKSHREWEAAGKQREMEKRGERWSCVGE